MITGTRAIAGALMSAAKANVLVGRLLAEDPDNSRADRRARMWARLLETLA